MQAPTYTRATDFAQDERDNVGGRSTVRTDRVDAELDAIGSSINTLRANQSLNQRDDGEIRDGRVKLFTLASDVLAFLTAYGATPRGAWTTATAYSLKDLVSQSGNTYINVTAHTSGVFATDLAAGKWLLFSLGAAAGATQVTFTPTATLAATNVQDAINEADTENRALIAAEAALRVTLAAAVSTLIADLANTSDIAKGDALLGVLQPFTGATAQTQHTKNAQTVHMEDFIVAGTAGTQAGDSAALKLAIAWAATNWLPVILPARRIYWDGTAIADDKVRLWGDGMPKVNSGRTALAGGTIIEGKLILSGKYIDLRDFGVDLGSAGAGPDADGIKVTCATLNGGEHLHLENLTTLCKTKAASTYHSMLFESYQKVTGGNLYSVYGAFGVVIKCQNVQLFGITTDQQNDTGLYLKSDNIYGTCSNVQITGIKCSNATTAGIRCQSDSAPMRNIELSQIHVTDCDRSVMVQQLNTAGTELKSISFNDLRSERAVTADASVTALYATGYIDNLSFMGFDAIDSLGKALEVSCQPGAYVRSLAMKDVYVSYPAGTSQAVMDSAIFLDAGVLSSDIDSVEVVENFGSGSKFGAVNYQNPSNPKYNILRGARCKVIGAGRPLPGNLDQIPPGTVAQTLSIPANISGAARSHIRVSPTAATQATIFAPEWATQTFEPGHLLTIYNNSAFVLTINHNLAGLIKNQGAANVAMAAGEVAAWIYDGAVWAQLKIA